MYVEACQLESDRKQKLNLSQQLNYNYGHIKQQKFIPEMHVK